MTMSIAEKLAAPFEAHEVRIRPGAIKNDRALALSYVDARSVMDRLDSVLGIDGWSDSYLPVDDGSVICTLSIRIDGVWISKSDVGSPSEQPDGGDRMKGAFSDALKRAAVKFGVGRYLYSLKPDWRKYDVQARKFVDVDGSTRHVATTKTVAQEKKPMTGKEFFEKLCSRENGLVKDGLCKPGDMVSAVANAVGVRVMADWDKVDVEKGVKIAREFVNQC